METAEVPSSSEDTDPPFSPHLGQLGRFPGEVRNLIYEYVLPPEEDRAFRAKRRFLPGKPPGLLFASKQIRQETIMLYFARTTWRILVKHSSTKDRIADGYFPASREPGATSLGHFSYRDAYTSLELNEDTPLFQQVLLERGSGDWQFLHLWQQVTVERLTGEWQSLLLKIVNGRPVVYHDNCPACGAKRRDRAQYASYQLRALYESYQFRRATRLHDEAVAAIQEALFGGSVIDSLGFSVRDIRETTGKITREVSQALKVQDDQIQNLRHLTQLGELW
ncbi:hypothetical protein KC343_g8071 [Hortaea werneckii]|nr:hypothetical protein KC352_g28713 [Hortaea werneckii]KAI7355015.1 hypothetical protein KC320_g3072 [Hortaea werneckii]KAI7559996.1 hypothetical protein KC317_g10011 [Hortaea werneckii]KAI7597269.1 hypothetical protein KC346_g14761 [Hortaea werneckii]KAI7621327.1 hypothetical protein KC343_g8071 [Hortaea werneckii]